MGLHYGNLFNSLANTLRNIKESFVFVPTSCYWLTIERQRLQLTKGRILPINRTQKNRNNACFSRVVSLYCTHHLHAITAFRCHERRANEQKNDLRFIEMLTNSLLPFYARTNILI